MWHSSFYGDQNISCMLEWWWVVLCRSVWKQSKWNDVVDKLLKYCAGQRTVLLQSTCPRGAKLFRSRSPLEIGFFFNSIFSSGAHSYWSKGECEFCCAICDFNIWWKHFTVFGLLIKRNSINAGIFRPTGVCWKCCKFYASSINI